MSLIRFNPGEIALSADVNNNFDYLNTQISDLSDTITTRTSSFSSQVTILNTTVQNLLGYRESFISTGMILPFAGDSLNIPDGYLECDGSEVLVSDFEDLYDVIGDTYGSSDSSSFCLPDLRSKTLWGAGTLNCGTYLTSALPNITGQFRLAGTEGSSAVSGAFSAGAKGGSYGIGHSSGAKNPLMIFDAHQSNSIYSDDCNIVQPPALCVGFIIKY